MDCKYLLGGWGPLPALYHLLLSCTVTLSPATASKNLDEAAELNVA